MTREIHVFGDWQELGERHTIRSWLNDLIALSKKENENENTLRLQ